MQQPQGVDATWRVACLCATVKFLYCAIIVLSSWIIANYDQSSSLGQGNLEQVATWDAVFFQAIAQHGYAYEQFYAFMPLLPWLLQTGYGAGDVSPSAMVLRGMLISYICSIIAAAALHRLTVLVLRDAKLAAQVSLLFIFSPASVFYAAPYTEALYSALAFSGMLFWCRPCKRTTLVKLVAAGLFSLATATRSNGITNCGFFLFDMLTALGSTLLAKAPWRGRREAVGQSHPTASTGAIVQVLLVSATACVVVGAPFIAFLWQGYKVFCVGYRHKGLSPPAWCQRRLPNVYSHVQAHYWGVGLFRYYTLQQLPNFALAAPVLTLTVAGVLTYAKHDVARFWSLGLLCKPRPCTAKDESQFDAEDKVLVFVLQWVALALIAALVMNVQVATRFLSTCPAMYWYLAHILQRSPAAVAHAVWFYCLVYMALGALLMPNFYPWT